MQVLTSLVVFRRFTVIFACKLSLSTVFLVVQNVVHFLSQNLQVSKFSESFFFFLIDAKLYSIYPYVSLIFFIVSVICFIDFSCSKLLKQYVTNIHLVSGHFYQWKKKRRNELIYICNYDEKA